MVCALFARTRLNLMAVGAKLGQISLFNRSNERRLMHNIFALHTKGTNHISSAWKEEMKMKVMIQGETGRITFFKNIIFNTARRL